MKIEKLSLSQLIRDPETARASRNSPDEADNRYSSLKSDKSKHIFSPLDATLSSLLYLLTKSPNYYESGIYYFGVSQRS